MASTNSVSARLPSGRHGLSREVVVRSQRERLMSAMIDAVAERGYARTSVGDVLSRARVSRSTFYERFADKEACFLAAHDEVIELLAAHVAAVYERPGTWPERVRAGLAALLHFVAANPEVARVAMVEIFAAGPRAQERSRAVAEAFVPFFEEGRRLTEHGAELPPSVSRFAVGGGIALVYSRVAADRTAELPGLLGELVYLTLAPFLGHEEALEEMRAAELGSGDPRD